jgi:hypothetical protein
MDGLTFPPTGGIGALSRHADHMEVWATASDGHVHLTWWDGTDWYDWRPLGEAVFRTGAPVTTLSRAGCSRWYRRTAGRPRPHAPDLTSETEGSCRQ